MRWAVANSAAPDGWRTRPNPVADGVREEKRMTRTNRPHKARKYEGKGGQPHWNSVTILILNIITSNACSMSFSAPALVANSHITECEPEMRDIVFRGAITTDMIFFEITLFT